MATVRDFTYRLLRDRGMTTIFGNPGSNELPFLAGIPDDFRYILGLHEGAVLAMADGYAQVTGAPTLVNLHAAAGTGNALGMLTNSVYSHSPLVVTAGQQVRSTIGQEVALSNNDAAALPRPLVKWSSEPACAEDVPRAMHQALQLAALPPAGPVYLSVPYDDWGRDVPPAAEHLLDRSVVRAGTLDDAHTSELSDALRRAAAPALVIGPEADTAAGFDGVTCLAELLGAPAWVAPSPSRCPFPTRHPLFRGVLPASVAGVSAALDGHDLVLVVGAPVFRYHQYVPGDHLPPGTRLVQLTADPGAAARAPVGEAIVCDPAGVVRQLVERMAPDARPAAYVLPPPEPPQSRDRVHPAALFAAVRAAAPDDAVYVVESTSTSDEFWQQMDLRKHGSFYFAAAGGLGFGLPATIGAQLAHDERGDGRRVVGLIGDGSANYGITGLWTAAAYRVPAVLIILNNGTYGALRWFADILDARTAPALDIPGIDFTALARGYGVPAASVTTVDEFQAEFKRALDSTEPSLIEVHTAHPATD